MKLVHSTLALVALAATSPLTKRHTTLQYISINGVDQPATALRLPGTNAPVTSVTSADMTCNVRNSGVAGIAVAKAGDTLTAEYHHDNSRASEFVDPSHKGRFMSVCVCVCWLVGLTGRAWTGPMSIYMGKVGNAKTATGTGNIWIKVFEDGYTASDRKWATDR